MWHFTTSTSTTLALLDDTRWTWNTEVPLQAESHAFLSHGVMAVAALHTCYLQPPNREEYHSSACHNYRKATVLFRSAVTEINRDNCIAILAFSLLVSIFQLNISNALGCPVPEESSLQQAADTLSALRGAWSLISQLHPHLSKSPISGLLGRRSNWDLAPMDDDHQRAFDNLESLNILSTGSPEDQKACGEAIKLLRFWFSMIEGSPSTWFHLVYWPSRISEEFLLLMKQGNPISLVIFGHWCVGMHRGPKRWFLAGWAQRTLSSIVKLLGPKWYPAMEWPINEVVEFTN